MAPKPKPSLPQPRPKRAPSKKQSQQPRVGGNLPFKERAFTPATTPPLAKPPAPAQPAGRPASSSVQSPNLAHRRIVGPQQAATAAAASGRQDAKAGISQADRSPELRVKDQKLVWNARELSGGCGSRGGKARR